MKKSILIILISLFISQPCFAKMTIEALVENQQKLEESLTYLETTEGKEQLFLEAILRRKNMHLRAQMKTSLRGAEVDPRLNELLQGQTKILLNLVKLSEKEILKLAKKSQNATGDAEQEIDLLLQKRIGTMDTYYQQLADTIRWGKDRQLEFSDQEKQLKFALEIRADFLTNAILYVNSLKKDVERRLDFVGETDKAPLTLQQSRLKERASMLAASLEVTVSLMEDMSLDTTEYKQILLVTTGDINADVLDYEVALSLLTGWGSGLKDWILDNLPSILVKVGLFLLILYTTRFIAKGASKTVGRSVAHSKMKFSVLMQEFFVSITSKAVTMVGIFIALSQIGIELGPLLTGFGVAGIIVGFALQDTLSNFASGLMILIYRPYDVKDLVQVAGIMGTVKKMSLVSTTIQTIDNQRLVIPNNKIWGDVINNITAETIRRVDMVFGIGYGDDIDKAKAILLSILEEHPKVRKKPEPMVKLHTLNSSSVDFVVRPWVDTEDYWEVYWEVTETVKKRFDQEGVSIPFPQRDVHLYQHGSVVPEEV